MHVDLRFCCNCIAKRTEGKFIERGLVKGKVLNMAAVVAQLVDRSLPTPEVQGSNPVIGKLIWRTFVYCPTVIKRQK